MAEFLVLIQWFHEVMKLVAAAAFGAMVILFLIALGILNVERKDASGR